MLRKNKTPAAVFPRKANIINWKSCVIRANKRNIYAYVYYYVRCRVFSAAFDVLKGLSVDFTACRVWFPTRLICVLSRFASRLQNGKNFDRVLYHRVVCLCVLHGKFVPLNTRKLNVDFEEDARADYWDQTDLNNRFAIIPCSKPALSNARRRFRWNVEIFNVLRSSFTTDFKK